MSDTKTYSLYGGSIDLTFNPTATKYRYTVDNLRTGVKGEAVRGVTSVLRDIIAKPDLMTWTLNMANAYYFGAKFDESTKEYNHDWSKAAIKPNRDQNGEITEPVTEDDLHEIMMEGSRQWTKRSDQGKDVGTLTHLMVEHYLTTQIEGAEHPKLLDRSEYSTEDLKMADRASESFRKWWNSLGDAHVEQLEAPVYSVGMKYAGTFDILANINGKRYLLDLKTTNASRKAPLGVYAEYFLQLGAYSHAYSEESGNQVDELGIVRVGKDGKLHIVTTSDLNMTVDECERAFAFAVRLHDMLSKTSPFLSDPHFKSSLIPSSMVDQEDSINE